MTEHRVITFDDFGAGEFGQRGRWKAKPNSFTGTNVVLYADGALGPRNGLKEISLTGIAPTGLVLGLGYNNAADAAGFKDTFFVIGTGVHVMDRDTGAGVTCATALGASATSPIQFIERGVTSYLSVPGDKMYRLTHAATPTVAALSASATVFSPGMTCLVQYGERTMAAGGGKAPDGTTSPGNRLYYSTASDPEAWTATNYIDVGDASSITALVVQRTHLVICKGDGSWWILTGVPGVNEVLRPIIPVGVAPAGADHLAAIGNGLVGYVIGSSATGSIASLGLFTGSSLALEPDLLFGAGRSGTGPTFSVQALKESDDWFVQGGKDNAPNDLALHQRGAWTIHEWAVSAKTLTGYVSSFVTADFHLFIVEDASAAPRFFRWQSYANRPAFTSDGGVQPGDASTTPLSAAFTLPEWFAPDGSEVFVRSVTVDFRKWNTGSGSTNHFDLAVRAVRLYEGDTLDSGTQSFDEAGASSSTSGTRQRKEFGFGDAGSGNGFQLLFSNLRGVAIEKIQVHAAISPARGTL